MSAQDASAVILAALEGDSLTHEETACFHQFPPAGFTLFRRNFAPDYQSIRTLTQQIQSFKNAISGPLLVAVDQEGGRVARLRSPFPNLGPALHLAGEGHDKDALQEIENYGFVVATVLRTLGINVNFAPVLDILTRDDNIAIGDRCFGRDAKSVSLRAGAYLRGLHSGGVWSCLKHFPGQGDASHDTHENGTKIEASRDTLKQRELIPFRALAEESPMIMISHAIYPAFDPLRPASLSSLILQGLLREKLRFRGLIVTDDMNMKAIDQSREPWCEAICASLAAGSDLILVCRELDRYRWAVEAIQKEAARSKSFTIRLKQARDRVECLRVREGRQPQRSMPTLSNS